MTPLATAIKALGWEQHTVDEIVSDFGETITTVLDSELHNNAWVSVQFDEASAEKLYQYIVGAGLISFATTYASVGLSLSEPQTQEQLAAISSAATQRGDTAFATFCQQLAAKGISTQFKWEELGLSLAPDTVAVTSALTEVNAESAIVARKSVLMTDVINPQKDDASIVPSQFLLNIVGEYFGLTKPVALADVQTAIATWDGES